MPLPGWGWGGVLHRGGSRVGKDSACWACTDTQGSPAKGFLQGDTGTGRRRVNKGGGTPPPPSHHWPCSKVTKHTNRGKFLWEIIVPTCLKNSLMFSSQDYQGQWYLNKIDSDSKKVINFFENKPISRINNMQCYRPHSHMFIHSLLLWPIEKFLNSLRPLRWEHCQTQISRKSVIWYRI